MAETLCDLLDPKDLERIRGEHEDEMFYRNSFSSEPFDGEGVRYLGIEGIKEIFVPYD